MEEAEQAGGVEGSQAPLSPEQELVQRAKRGDRSAQALLYRAFFDPLQRHLARQVGPHLARAVSVSDLAQDAFLNSLDALRVLPDDAGTKDFRAILYRHARWMISKAYGKHRRFQGESALGEPILPEAVLDRAADRSAGDVTRGDENGWLHQQIEKLPPDFAEVLRLRLQGLELAEIAAELDVPYETARKRVLRASQRLSERLGES